MPKKTTQNVTIISTSFPTKENETSGIFVATLADELNKHINVTVVTPSYQGQKKYFYKNIPVFPCRYATSALEIIAHSPGGIPVTLKKNKLLYLLVPFLLFSLLEASWRRGRHSDILHANWAVCGAIGGIIAYFSKKPLITSLRGEDIHRAKNSLFDRIFLKMTLRFSSRIIAVSDAIKHDLIKNYPQFKSKIVTIYNGVDKKFIVNGSCRKAKQKNTLTLLTVSSLIERKGIDQIISAIPHLNKNKQIKLIIVGDGPEKEKLQKLVNSHRLHKCVSFVGTQSHDEISHFMEKADIFILASHSEGRANVLLEAMASGLAIISSNINGSKELIKDNLTGLLFTVTDTRQLAKNIEYYYSQSLRNLYGNAAHKYIINSRLTWNNTAQQYINQYTTVTTRR